MLTISKLSKLTVKDLQKLSKEAGIKAKDIKGKTKNELIKLILQASANQEGYEYVSGILEVMNDGHHGILHVKSFVSHPTDVYVSSNQIRNFGLRSGDIVSGIARPYSESQQDKLRNMLRVDFVGDHPAPEAKKRPYFYDKKPIFPDRRLRLETKPSVVSTRLIDLLIPVGYGQRGMIVAPPMAGKTWLMKDIANGITTNNPEAYLMVVLVGERPEEVTDMERSVKGEVIASNFDEPPAHNVKVAELALEKAKRLVEWGHNVVILMDSITRLARAYNLSMPSSGRTLTGGFDPVAIYPPKRFFGAARNFEDGSSLTILATALVQTGSRMDDLIYEEFKGTGNMELHLSRELAERKIYPAIDIQKSGTRREDLLYTEEELKASWMLRKMLDAIKQEGENPTEFMIEKLKSTNTNKELISRILSGS